MRLLPPLATCLALAGLVSLAACGPDDGAGVRDVPAPSSESDSGTSSGS